MLMLTVPHSGEIIPDEATWLKNIDPLVLLTDVDRFVDELYKPACQALHIPMEVMEIHRYVLDANRLPTDVDASLVEGISAPGVSGKTYVSGFHWARTTQGVDLLKKPLSFELHEKLIQLYYNPFHARIQSMEKTLIKTSGLPRYHLDVHSMPSQGTKAHKDFGKKRPDVVISDCNGKSCSAQFKDLVIASYEKYGFHVSYNWPYLGGRMTEQYGKPQEGRHSIQVELNRALYMNEETKEKLPEFKKMQETLIQVLEEIYPDEPS